MIKLSVVVPTYRRARLLFRLLDSLSRQSLARDRFEVLVVSNFDDAELWRALGRAGEALSNVRLLVAGAKGANASRNIGIKESRGDILLLLDDDCIVENKGYLQAVMDHHRERPDALAIGGCYSIPDGCRPEDVAYNIISRDWQLSGHGAGGFSLRLLGGNVSYKKALLDNAGELFNPGISYGGAELEFHGRLAGTGATLLLAPELTVHHVPEIRGSGELVKKAYKQAITTVRFSIGEGEGDDARGHQSRRNILALRHAKDEQELERICDIMLGYDQAYNMVVRGRAFSLSKLKARLAARRLRASLGLAG
jgi:glycosyltransferase involved in cell wall biosynthesis